MVALEPISLTKEMSSTAPREKVCYVRRPLNLWNAFSLLGNVLKSNIHYIQILHRCLFSHCKVVQPVQNNDGLVFRCWRVRGHSSRRSQVSIWEINQLLLLLPPRQKQRTTQWRTRKTQITFHSLPHICAKTHRGARPPRPQHVHNTSAHGRNNEANAGRGSEGQKTSGLPGQWDAPHPC